jgi:hypothetical protein
VQFVGAVGEGVPFVVVDLVADVGPALAQGGGDLGGGGLGDARVLAALDDQQRGLDLTGVGQRGPLTQLPGVAVGVAQDPVDVRPPGRRAGPGQFDQVGRPAHGHAGRPRDGQPGQAGQGGEPAVAASVHGHPGRIDPVQLPQVPDRSLEVFQVDAAPVPVDPFLPGLPVPGGAAYVRRQHADTGREQALDQRIVGGAGLAGRAAVDVQQHRVPASTSGPVQQPRDGGTVRGAEHDRPRDHRRPVSHRHRTGIGQLPHRPGGQVRDEDLAGPLGGIQHQRHPLPVGGQGQRLHQAGRQFGQAQRDIVAPGAQYRSPVDVHQPGHGPPVRRPGDVLHVPVRCVDDLDLVAARPAADQRLVIPVQGRGRVKAAVVRPRPGVKVGSRQLVGHGDGRPGRITDLSDQALTRGIGNPRSGQQQGLVRGNPGREYDFPLRATVPLPGSGRQVAKQQIPYLGVTVVSHRHHIPPVSRYPARVGQLPLAVAGQLSQPRPV